MMDVPSAGQIWKSIFTYNVCLPFGRWQAPLLPSNASSAQEARPVTLLKHLHSCNYPSSLLHHTVLAFNGIIPSRNSGSIHSSTSFLQASTEIACVMISTNFLAARASGHFCSIIEFSYIRCHSQKLSLLCPWGPLSSEPSPLVFPVLPGPWGDFYFLRLISEWW
jgi:hypothetical protein